jgi:hypothetical protein
VDKKVVILGGGTFNHVRSHLALSAPAFGTTAARLEQLAQKRFPNMEIDLRLTKMADPESTLVTNRDVEKLVDELILDNTVKVIFFNVALCDYEGLVGSEVSGKNADRLSTSKDPVLDMSLVVAPKIISKIRENRKDIFLVGFKTTTNATEEEQYSAALNLLKTASVNLVLANDTGTRNNFIVTPEEGVYNGDREECLQQLVDMAYWRSHLSFTRSTVISGEPVAWEDAEVPSALRRVVDWCVSEGAYKTFNGVTTGHFAAKIGEGEFLTSIRKTNFNDIEDNGMVRVKTDGDDDVISYGAKPSVGGQSQRLVFGMYPTSDSIVHFHCPLRTDAVDDVPVVSQKEYECGSNECGQNTANGLLEVRPGIFAVMLDNHGPNIVFNSKTVHPLAVISFINDNFDLDKSTSGFEQAYLTKCEETAA